MASSQKPRRRSKAAKASEAPAKQSIMSRVLRRAWRPIPLLMAALGLSAVMFWPEIAHRIPELRHRIEYQLAWSQLAITPPKGWVPSDIAAEVCSVNGLPDPLPVLDEHLAEQLAIAFARHPWVAEVVSVRKLSPRRIEVDLRYREPVLMVRMKGGGVYPVDRDGVLLPPSDFTLRDTVRFPLVDGVLSVPAGGAGTAWGDPAVLGAARLAEQLIHREQRTSAWERFQMARIQILQPPRPAESLEEVLLGIITKSGSQIVWGRPPGADTLEPTFEQKLARLEKYLPEYGEADGTAAPVQLEIQRLDVVELLPQVSDDRRWR
jgi:hypothetical protein